MNRTERRANARATSRAVRKAQYPNKDIKGMSAKRARTVIGEEFYTAIARDRIQRNRKETIPECSPLNT